MVDFTLLELHFEDSDLTANAPYSRGGKDATQLEEPPAEGGSSGKGKIFALLVGLVFSIAVAYLVRKKVLGSDGADENDASTLDIE